MVVVSSEAINALFMHPRNCELIDSSNRGRVSKNKGSSLRKVLFANEIISLAAMFFSASMELDHFNSSLKALSAFVGENFLGLWKITSPSNDTKSIIFVVIDVNHLSTYPHVHHYKILRQQAENTEKIFDYE